MLTTYHWFRIGLIFAGLAAIVVGVRFWFQSPAPRVRYESIETRRYRLATPDPPSDSPLPIIVVFHGIGDTPDSMAAYSGLDRLAAEGKAYVVYPETRMGMWNIDTVKPEDYGENRDLLWLDRLLDRLKREFPTDRVALVGMSNGALFAQLAAQARTDIERVVAHSGSKPRDLEIVRTTPMLLVVGDRDPVADAVRKDATQYRAAGCQVTGLEKPGLGHAWSNSFDAEIDAFLMTTADDHDPKKAGEF